MDLSASSLLAIQMAPKVPEDLNEGGRGNDDSMDFSLAMRLEPMPIPITEQQLRTDTAQAKLETDQIINKISEIALRENDIEDDQFQWSFRSINIDEDEVVPCGTKRDNPCTPCSPALLQKNFSWGYLNVGIKKTRSGSFSLPEPLLDAPQLPTEADVNNADAEASQTCLWLPAPCFSPLAGRTTLGRCDPSILQRRMAESSSEPLTNNTNISHDSELLAINTSVPPPVLPDSPSFQTRPSLVSLPMRRGDH